MFPTTVGYFAQPLPSSSKVLLRRLVYRQPPSVTMQELKGNCYLLSFSRFIINFYFINHIISIVNETEET
jgi:uncharacterized membrane protein